MSAINKGSENKTSVFLAYKLISRGNKSSVVLLIFILVLVFINMMFIAGIMSGFTDAVYKSLVDTSTSDIELGPQQTPRVHAYIDSQNDVQKKLQTIPGVEATTREYLTESVISYDKNKDGQFKSVASPIWAVNPVEESKVLTISNYLVAGEYITEHDTGQIVLGSGLTGGFTLGSGEDLGGVRIGDKVNVTFSNGITKSFTIKGVYELALSATSYGAVINTSDIDNIFGTYNQASTILVKTDLKKNSLDYYAQKIQQMFPYNKVRKYTDILAVVGPLVGAFNLITLIMSIVSVMVAAVTIFVLIYINAVNRRKQIGILRAIGIRTNIIVKSYALVALFYTFSGILLGSLFVFVLLSPFLYAHPIILPFGPVSLIFSAVTLTLSIASLLIAGILAGIIPSRIVAKHDLLDTIWGR
jgi:putative ABC transport system permease protein